MKYLLMTIATFIFLVGPFWLMAKLVDWYRDKYPKAELEPPQDRCTCCGRSNHKTFRIDEFDAPMKYLD